MDRIGAGMSKAMRAGCAPGRYQRVYYNITVYVNVNIIRGDTGLSNELRIPD